MRNKNLSSATARSFEPDAARLFSELGYSATFFDAMPSPIVILDANGHIQASNESFRNEILQTDSGNWHRFTTSGEKVCEKHLSRALSVGSHRFITEYETASGLPAIFEIDAFRLSDGKSVALLHRPKPGNAETFWRLPEKSSDSGPILVNDFYQSILDSKQPIAIVKSDGRIRSVNRGFSKLLGFDSSVYRFREIGDFVVSEEPMRMPGEIVGCHALWRVDGNTTSCRITAISGHEGDTILAFEEQEQEVQDLRSEEFYSVFVNQTENEIARFDLIRPISLTLPVSEQIERILNQSFLRSYSKPQSTNSFGAKEGIEPGTLFKDFFISQKAAEAVARLFIESGYKVLQHETEVPESEDSSKHFRKNIMGVIEQGRLTRIWLFRRDITLQKRAELAYQVAEDQLRQSQKIEPIGRLAGGIAHDFNNFLAVIMLQTEMMRQEIRSGDPLLGRIGEIMNVTEKAANMVKQLLAFGRKQTMRPHHLLINQVIEEFVKMTGSLLGEDIEIHLDLDPEVWVCFVDPNQIIQILMNLAVNARDAMPHGGVLNISTANLTIDENTFKHRAQPKGRYVELRVEDNGCGMDAVTQKHIFEPFFTTKETHKGTGLGLATVYGIVKQSKGFIWVDSTIDKGTVFKVHFPGQDQTAVAVKRRTAGAIPRGDETILLVEDEDLIRKTSVEVLKSLGYKILEARNGEDAARVAAEYGEPIHLLLTDVVMPKMNGRELAKQAKIAHPEISVLFMSGYADDIITRHGILEKDVFFLGKPFTPLTLANRVREALGPK
ncbi:MAG: ATP-binding protein [Pyrinomonadaceae bacterium]